MSDKKQLDIGVGITVDPSGLQTLQQKLKEIQGATEMMKSNNGVLGKLQGTNMGGMMSGASADSHQRSTEKLKQSYSQLIQMHVKFNEALNKEYQTQLAKEQELIDKLKTKSKESAEYLEIEKQIAAVKQNTSMREQQIVHHNKTFGKDIASYSSMGGSQPEPEKPKSQVFDKEFAGILTKSLGTVAAIVAGGAAVYDNYTSIPLKRNAATGGAIQSVVGSDLQSVGGGDVVGSMAWMAERQKSRGMAGEKLESSKFTDRLSAASGVGAISNMLFSDGRTMKLLAGGLTDVLARSMEGIGKGTLNNLSGYKNLTEKVHGVASEYMSGYQSSLIEEYGKNYQQNLDSEKKMNPLKNLAVSQFSQNAAGDLQTQRSLGLNYESFHGEGGYKERANLAGFNPEVAAATSSQIMSAGGSTRGGQNPILAMQAARGYGMTNAGSAFGKISGGAGQASEQVFKKLLAESVKDGLDDSAFREENKKFTEAAAQVLGQSGVTDEGDAGRILAGLSKYIPGNPTMQQMTGGLSAYQETQSQSQETSGRGGAMQFAAMSKQGLSGIGAMGMGALMEMPDSDVITTNQMIMTEAVSLGITPEEMVKKVHDGKREKQLADRGLDKKKVDSTKTYLDKKGFTPGSLSIDDNKTMERENPEAFNYYKQMSESTTLKGEYNGPAMAQARLRGLFSATGEDNVQKPNAATATYGAMVDKKLNNKNTGLAEDQVVAASGAAAQAMLENFRNFKDQIVPAASAVGAFTKSLMLLTTVIDHAADKDKAYVAEAVGKYLGTQQPQAGKKSK